MTMQDEALLANAGLLEDMLLKYEVERFLLDEVALLDAHDYTE